MSVLLNITTMPKTCEVCPCNDDNWRCGATGEHFDYEDMHERRRADCPLIEVPPHGRLIDADELSKQKYENIWTNCLVINADDLDDAHTVIEAEEKND